MVFLPPSNDSEKARPKRAKLKTAYARKKKPYAAKPLSKEAAAALAKRGGAPSAVGVVLDKITKAHGLRKHFDQGRIWQMWDEIAGTRLAPHGKPKLFKDKTLLIAIQSPVWMSRYAYSKWDLIKRVNLVAGYELINDLFFVLEDDDTILPPQDNV